MDAQAESLRLRTALRDLVALSTIPAAWVGREPPAIAAGLADVLVGALHLDFVFVRLGDPSGGAVVDVTRGEAWNAFPDWLQRRLAVPGHFSRKEIVANVGGGRQPCRGVVIPIGVNGNGGLVAAACDRGQFPDETDQLLLSVAANHAATAFQSARLIQEHRRAEEALARARNELETKVVERTAELRLTTTEALAAQQRFRDLVNSVEGIVWEADAETFVFSFVSEQAERILGYPVEHWLNEPTFWSDHLHPDDRARLKARARNRNLDREYRMIAADGRVVWLRDLATVVVEGDRATRLRGVMVDITERKRTEEERQAHLRFVESMERVNRAIQGTNDPEQMMSGVLEAVLSTFECDRAWLVYPCDPEAPSWGVAMEHTRSEFPGAFVLGRRFPASPDIVEVFRTVRASSAPVRFGPGSEHPLPADLAERFSIQSQIATAVYPKVGEPYMFGLHQCSYPRVWTPQEEILFKAIGRRLADALTSLLIFRNLRQSEARLAEAERIAHVGYWHRDLDTDRLTWSEETYRIFGLAPQEGTIDFTGFQELIHPEDRQIMARAVAQTLHGGPRYDVEYRVVRPNGEVRIVHSQGDVTRDESGRFGRMLGTIQDITDRKQAEEELRESERRYRYIFDSTGVSIWEEDFSEVKDAIDDLRSRGVRDFREYFAAHPEFVQQAITMVKIVDVNNASVKLFAAESKDELLVSLHRVFTPETQEVFVDELIAIAEGRTSFGAETVLRTLRGERLTALFTITFPGPSARFDGVLVTVVDITERKRAEYLTGQVFESSPDRISIIGRDYRYQRVNPVFERYWGVPAEKAVGMRVPDVLGVEVFEDRVRQNLDRCFAGEDASYAGWFGNARGRRYVAVSFSPLRPDSERVEAALVIGRDLTEYMLASEALHQAQAELAHVTRVTTLGELAASIAHEVNQPLAAIVADANASLNWLAATDPDLDEVRDALAAIVKDGHRAAEVIQRIRQLATKTDPQKVPIDVNEIIRDVVPLVHPEVRRYHVSLRVELASALTPVLGDRVQLQQVILNLVMNGIEAMASVGERPRELVIRSGPHDHDHIVVAVQDAGVGIDPKNLDQLFSAFFTTKPGGMGMGLSITRSIIDGHGGRLWATPNATHGATFQFALPRI